MDLEQRGQRRQRRRPYRRTPWTTTTTRMTRMETAAAAVTTRMKTTTATSQPASTPRRRGMGRTHPETTASRGPAAPTAPQPAPGRRWALTRGMSVVLVSSGVAAALMAEVPRRQVCLASSPATPAQPRLAPPPDPAVMQVPSSSTPLQPPPPITPPSTTTAGLTCASTTVTTKTATAATLSTSGSCSAAHLPGTTSRPRSTPQSPSRWRESFQRARPRR
mmetsp:Transcript_37162/g.92418  ORF Transcript_37162/g.92418 Transcript_37162/m.92418 type:complete len:220 (+) Transcript_37162:68-727(+)